MFGRVWIFVIVSVTVQPLLHDLEVYPCKEGMQVIKLAIVKKIQFS